jgi:hypothetical protein
LDFFKKRWRHEFFDYVTRSLMTSFDCSIKLLHSSAVTLRVIKLLMFPNFFFFANLTFGQTMAWRWRLLVNVAGFN